MDFRPHIDVLILTWNEEPNLARTLAALESFPRVTILDSGSSDMTVQIARRHPHARVIHRPFDSHAQQWTFGLNECGLSAEWVLALDADYVLTPAVEQEIGALQPPADVSGYRARFRYCVEGTPLRGTLYPPVTLLFRRTEASYIQDGHAHRVQLRSGRVLPLAHEVLHDDRKSFSFWLAAQDRYARLECELLRTHRWGALRWRDRLRKMVVITPWLVPLYCLTVGRGLLDGRHGLFYALQRGIAETLLSARLVEAALRSRERP